MLHQGQQAAIKGKKVYDDGKYVYDQAMGLYSGVNSAVSLAGDAAYNAAGLAGDAAWGLGENLMYAGRAAANMASDSINYARAYPYMAASKTPAAPYNPNDFLPIENPFNAPLVDFGDVSSLPYGWHI